MRSSLFFYVFDCILRIFRLKYFDVSDKVLTFAHQ